MAMEESPAASMAIKRKKKGSTPAVEVASKSFIKRKKSIDNEMEEAERLQRVLFGNLENPASSAFGLELEGQLKHENRESAEQEDVVDGRKPAWEDDEEGEARVKLSNVNRLRKLLKVGDGDSLSRKEYVSRLRAFHAKLNPSVAWAELPSDKRRKKRNAFLDSNSDEEEEDEGHDDASDLEKDVQNVLLSHREPVVKSKTRLPQGLIGILRLRDGNVDEPSNAVVQSVEFHRNAQLLLTAGFDKRLRLFQVDGKRNPKVQSIFLHDFPIQKAAFVPDGSCIVASARRKFYYVYDLNAGAVQKMDPLIGREEKSLEKFEVSPDSKTVAFLGNEGYILLASLKTKQLICTLKMNGSVRALSFANNGQELLSSGDDGEVYHWDVGSRRCIHKGRDEGCIKSTALSVSQNSMLFATGSNSGVVNVYEKEKFVKGEIKPVKSFMNLLTTVDNLKFNPDCQILAMSSRMKRNALRLVHVPSCTVFSNWPTVQTPLQYVHSLDFSPGGGYLAVGNAAGKVLLYRLHHYDHA